MLPCGGANDTRAVNEVLMLVMSDTIIAATLVAADVVTCQGYDKPLLLAEILGIGILALALRTLKDSAI